MDTLSGKIIENTKIPGLGIIEDDLRIFKIKTEKKIVSVETEEGIEIKLFEYLEN